MTLSRPSTTLSPKRSEPSWQRIVFLSPMCTQRPISIVRQLRGRLDLHALAEEHHAAGDDVRVGQLELQQSPVADQVPRRVRPVGDHPLQRRQREELGLARVAQPRTPPPLVHRCAPHRRHGRKAYASAARPPTVTLTWARCLPGRTHVLGDSIALASTRWSRPCLARLREHRLLGRRQRRGRLVRPVRRRRATAATPPSAGAESLRLDWTPLGQGRPRRRGGARLRQTIWRPTRRPRPAAR